jgi:hypothetical protein
MPENPNQLRKHAREFINKQRDFLRQYSPLIDQIGQLVNRIGNHLLMHPNLHDGEHLFSNDITEIRRLVHDALSTDSIMPRYKMLICCSASVLFGIYSEVVGDIDIKESFKSEALKLESRVNFNQ